MNEEINLNVSIHAPVWRAAGKEQRGGNQQAVSIHAPVWRAAHNNVGQDCGWARFQSHPRVEAACSRRLTGAGGSVSINAPPCGGRQQIPRQTRLSLVSIHAPCGGGYKRTEIVPFMVSIHAPRVEADHLLRQNKTVIVVSIKPRVEGALLLPIIVRL
jgi:hypothetical protein